MRRPPRPTRPDPPFPSTTLFRAPRRIDRHDRPAHQICVSVRGQPTERCCSTTGTVLRRRADDYQSVCFVENSVHGRVHDSGATVGDDDVVMHLENSQSIEVVLLVERLRSFRICLTRKDFESAVALRGVVANIAVRTRSEEHTSELQSLVRISYAVFCLNKKI